MITKCKTPLNIEEIDDYIKDIVSMLNKNGLKTIYSCSGLKEDHLTENKHMGMDGYILFEELNEEKQDIIQSIANKANIIIEMPRYKEVFEIIDGKKCNHKTEYDPRCLIRTYMLTIANINTDEIKEKYIKKQWDNLKNEIEN